MLSVLFLESMPAARQPRWSVLSDLEARLVGLRQEGRDAWPSVAVDDLIFLTYLATRDTGDEPVEQFLSRLDGAGLYFAGACLAGIPQALELLDRRYLA